MITTDARAELLRLIIGFQASQAIHVAAALGLADLLDSDPKPVSDLARATKTKPNALYRLMRALASIGIFREEQNLNFALAPMGKFLRTDTVGSHAPMAQFIGRSNSWQAWGDLLHAVRTGDTAFNHVHGRGVWEYRAEHPEESLIFDRAMAEGTEQYAQAVMQFYDFGRFRHVVDVGGGDGAFLGRLLDRYPSMQGTLFDQPHVIERAEKLFAGLDLSQRCRMCSGNFFTDVPHGADAYLLKWILHDWDDEAAIKILRTCRRATTQAGRLLIVEHVVGPPNVTRDAKFMDLTMMVMNGGKERTEAELTVILSKAGFRLTSLIETEGPQSLIEAIPAES